MSAPPPRLLVRTLEALLPAGLVGESMVGDVVEEWHRREPGPLRALWFGMVVVALAIRYAAVRALGQAAALIRSTAPAARRALRNPVQTGFTVLALGIGIAAPATMFSIVDGLVGEVGLDEPDRVVHIGRRFTPTVVGIAPLDWLRPAVPEIEAFESAGLYARGSVDLSGEQGYAERLDVVRVTPGVFGAFGSGPAMGRTFDSGDAGGDRSSVVLGWALWQARFGADPSILGTTVRLDGAPRAVIGVMPEGFDHPGGVDLWAPLDLTDPSLANVANYQAVGRLAPGATLEAVRARIAATNESLRQRGETIPAGGGLTAQLWRDSLLAPAARRMLSVMVLLVGFVLVIACADVLNLLLARALSRSRETAVRLALGAARMRIVAEHLAEAAVVATLAGLVGLGLTAGALRIFEAETAGQLAHWMNAPRIDLPVLLFGAGMVALAALLTGVVPAVQSSRVDVGPALRDGGRGTSSFRIGRLSKALVVGEIALSFALLAVAGTMVRGAVTTVWDEIDYATTDVVTARFELRPDAYTDDEVQAFQRRLVEETEAQPGVASAALASHLPGVFAPTRTIEIAGREAERPEDFPRSHVVSASPAFLDALGSSVVRGRALTWDDATDGPPSVLVNEAFVREHFPAEDPLGARIRLADAAAETEDAGSWSTVVGVVPDLGLGAEAGAGGAGVYLPVSAAPARALALMVRADAGTDPLALAPELRATVADLDPDLALWAIDTLARRQLEGPLAVQSVIAALFLTFGLAGLLLVGVGLYGLLSFTVHRRVPELGVRIAMGAAPLGVLRTAVGGGVLQLALGLGIGLGLAALVGPLFGPALLGADPRDPFIYLLVAGVLGITGAVAMMMPAGRALRVDVVEVLRTE